MNSLVKKGYVKRERSEKDRRVVFIQLTNKGRMAYHHHAEFHRQMTEAVLAELNEDETEVLVKALDGLRKFFRQYQDVYKRQLYILHPNNIGRCGHICNASYAVSRDSRGLHIGEKLVSDCLIQGKEHGFGVLQFNAVVACNVHARHLYERLGFTQLGVIPKGFRMKDGHYEDICPY